MIIILLPAEPKSEFIARNLRGRKPKRYLHVEMREFLCKLKGILPFLPNLNMTTMVSAEFVATGTSI